MMSTEPAHRLRPDAASEDLCTTTWLTISGRQQAVAHAAADRLHLAQHEPVASADRMTVDQGLGEAGIGATQADAIALVEAAFAGAGRADVDARQALQRVGHVLGRQLADVLGGDHFDVGGRVLLQRQRFRLAVADAGHRDGAQLLGLGLVRAGRSPTGRRPAPAAMPAKHRLAMMLAANNFLRCDMVSSPQRQVSNGCFLVLPLPVELLGECPVCVERLLLRCCRFKIAVRCSCGGDKTRPRRHESCREWPSR